LFDGAVSTNGFCRLHDGNQRLCGGTGVVDFSQIGFAGFPVVGVLSIGFCLAVPSLVAAAATNTKIQEDCS